MSKPKTLRQLVEQHPEWLDLPIYVVNKATGNAWPLGYAHVVSFLNNTTKKQAKRLEIGIK